MKKILSIALAAMMAIPMIASAHGPSRQKVEEKIVINASPDKVWKVVGDFCWVSINGTRLLFLPIWKVTKNVF